MPADRFLVMDGAMGTMLQKSGLEPGERPEMMNLRAPKTVTEVHRAYIEAGSNIISTNTFGANRLKLEKTGHAVEDVVCKAVQAAQAARASCAERGGDVRIALDVGPIGELLEPSGTLTFEEAYELFAETMIAGEKYGADLILIETMTDLYEAKAALLAAKEKTSLPVLLSMSFEKNGRTLTGTPVEAMAVTLGGLKPAALGINCSLGPAEIVKLAERLCEATPLPVFLKPNAGLPDAITGLHRMDAETFAAEMEPCFSMGISMVGGCCGTDPETIRTLAAMFGGRAPAQRVFRPKNWICSSMQIVELSGVTPIGEKINPTGKGDFQEELLDEDFSTIESLVMDQEDEGVTVLDVNVGAPGVDEALVLPRAVKAIQTLTRLPLVLDSSSPKALEAALRVYNGKAIVNSTTAADARLAFVLGLCRKYGAAFVGLTMDNKGIPETAEERFALAEKIVNAALAAGIPREDIIIDCVSMPAIYFPALEEVTLEAVALVKEKLGVKTILGISNISFGCPNRVERNQAFLTKALAAGLDLPILDPMDSSVMKIVEAAGRS